MAHDRHDVAFFVGAIIGGVAGGAAMLFAAPQSGAATRSELRSQVETLRGRTERLSDQTRERVQGGLAGVQEVAAPVIARFGSGSADNAVRETESSVIIQPVPTVDTEVTIPPAASETVNHRSASDLDPTRSRRDTVAPTVPASEHDRDTPSVAVGTDFPTVKR